MRSSFEDISKDKPSEWCGAEWHGSSRLSERPTTHHGCALEPGHSDERPHRCLCGATHQKEL
jgi:hypothetical protein